MNACTALPESAGFICSTVRFIDCRAELLGSGAWQALAMPGSTLSVVLTGFLTIFIALFGYRLLLGESLTLRDGTLAMVKIGIVFALATSWPAYRTLIYDLVTDAPAQLASEIGRSSAVPGSDGTLVKRLDLADGALVQLAILGPGIPVLGEDAGVAPPPVSGFSAFAIGGSRILFLLATVAGLGIVRIVAALMLALGPLFIAFLLFDTTRSLFEGWVRVLAGAALGMVGVTVTLGLQLALFEPWLSGILARRMSGEALPSIPTELLVTTALFAILIGAVIVASARLTRAFRFASLPARVGAPAASIAGQARAVPSHVPSRRSAGEERSRAAAVADVLVAVQRRERLAGGAAGARSMPAPADGPSAMARSSDAGARHISRGQSMPRRTRARGSASADRRDRG